MLEFSYYRYFIRFSDDYIRDKSSLYAIYKSAKKRIRDYVKISIFLYKKIKKILRRFENVVEIIALIRRSRAHIDRRIT